MDVKYIIIVTVLLLCFFIDWNKKNKACSILSVLTVLAFVGLRARVVGGDTIDYVRYFEGHLSFYSDAEHVEFLYRVYNNFLGFLLFHKGELFVLFHSFLVLLPLYLLAKKTSNSIPLACLFFVIGKHYVYYMAAMRQILGIGIVLLGVWYFIEEKKYKWIVFVASGLLGYLLHSSAIITFIGFLGCYFAPLKNKKIAYIILVSSALIGFVFKELNVLKFMEYLSLYEVYGMERMFTYLDDWNYDDVSSTLSWTVLFKPTLLGCVVFYMMDEKLVNHWFSKVFVLSIVLGNLFIDIRLIDRLNLSFSVISIICVTWMFSSKYYVDIKERWIYKLLIISVLFVYTQSYVKNNIEYDRFGAMLLHPYYFCWEDYRGHPALFMR